MVSHETECLHFDYDVHIARTVGNIIPSSSEAQCLHLFARSHEEKCLRRSRYSYEERCLQVWNLLS